MKKITKAVIPAAGFGTRFLPQTKAMPKESGSGEIHPEHPGTRFDFSHQRAAQDRDMDWHLQGRAVVKQRSVYTIVTCLPIEADGRPRYRIKSKTENVERVVTEEQISRLG